MSAITKLEAAGNNLTKRYRTGPVKKEPGVFYASSNNWWFDFWNQFSPRGEKSHEVEDHAVQADSPEKNSAFKAAHEMTTMELERYVQQKGWTSANRNNRREEDGTSVGDQMLRDVVRKELQARGKTVYF